MNILKLFKICFIFEIMNKRGQISELPAKQKNRNRVLKLK